MFVQFCAKTFEAFKRICSMLMCRRLLPYFWDWVVSPHLPVKENIFLESGFHHWSAITMVGRWWSGKGKKEGSDNLRREKIWRRLFTAGKYYKKPKYGPVKGKHWMKQDTCSWGIDWMCGWVHTVHRVRCGEESWCCCPWTEGASQIWARQLMWQDASGK